MIVWDTFVRYLGISTAYIFQAIPCMLIGLAVFFVLQPVRKKMLNRLDLSSSQQHDCVLAIFFCFCSGLAALTLFPSGFWSEVLRYIFSPDIWAEGLHLSDFYLSKTDFTVRLENLGDILAPFQEIKRAARVGAWLLFMLLGNIIIFVPIGFFTGILWRHHHWWKSVLIGCTASFLIESIQFFIGRSTDIDDIILNTSGTLVGYWIFLLFHNFFPSYVSKLRCQEREENF